MSKKGHAGGVNAYFPNLFFHQDPVTTLARKNTTRHKEKKCKVPEKRGILLTHQNFGKKPRSKSTKKIDVISQGNREKKHVVGGP